MEHKFCEKCGAPLPEKGKFCISCGTPFSLDANQTEESDLESLAIAGVLAGGTKDEADTAARMIENISGRKEPKMYKKCSFAASFCAFCLGILAFLFGVIACVFLYLKDAPAAIVSEHAISKFSFAEIDVELIRDIAPADIDTSGDSLAAIIVDNGNARGLHLNESDVEEMLESHALNDFIDNKISDYISDFTTGDGKGVITEREVVNFVRKNQETIEDGLNLRLDDSDFENLETYLKEELKLSKKTKLSGITDSFPIPVDFIRYSFTIVPFIIMTVLCSIFLLLILLLKGKPLRGLLNVGITVLFIGLVNIALAVGIIFFPDYANQRLALGQNVYKAFLQPLQNMSFLYGSICFGVGLIFTIIGGILRHHAKGRYYKSDL